MTLKRPDPKKPLPALMVIDNHVIESSLRKYESGRFLLDEDTQVISYPFSPQDKDFISKHLHLPKDYNAVSIKNKLFLLDKNSYKYIEIEELKNNSPLKRVNAFCELCQALGAKRVVFDVKKSEDSETKFNFLSRLDGLVKKIINAEVDSSATWKDKITDQIKCEHVFKGGMRNFEEAERIIKKYNLRNDTAFVNLINMCKSENSISKYNQELSLTKNIEIGVKIAAELCAKIPTGQGVEYSIAEMKASFEAIRQSFTEIKLKVTIEF
jgi:hypothetical protein